MEEGLKKSETRSASRAALLLLAAVFLLHVLAVAGFARFFSFGSGYPLLTQDYAVRSQNLLEVREAFSSSGRMWGYSPSHEAGHPSPLTLDLDAKLDEVVGLLCGFLPAGLVLKLWIVLLLLLIVPAAALAVRLLGASALETALAAGLVEFFLWREPAPNFLRYGMYSYIAAGPVCLLLFALFVRLIDKPSLRRAAAFILLGAAAFSLHVLAPVIVLLPAAVYLIASRPSHRALGAFLGAAAAIVLLNFYWLYPLWRFRDYIAAGDGESAALITVRSFHLMYLRVPDVPLLVLLAAGGLALLWKAGRRALAAALAAGIAGHFLLSLWGHGLGLSFLTLEHRFIWPLCLFAAWPAARCMSRLAEKLRERGAPLPAGVGFALLLTLLLAGGLLCRKWYRENLIHLATPFDDYYTSGAYKYAPSPLLPAEGAKLLAWIKTETLPDARGLVEDSATGTGTIYWQSVLPAMIPRLTGRDIVGGPYAYAYDLFHRTDFSEGRLLGRPIGSFGDEELIAVIRRYNIGWVVAFSEEAVRRFDFAPGIFKPMGRIGPFHLYWAMGSKGYVLNGTGECRAAMDRIVCRGVRSEHPPVLSFHYIETLQGEGGVGLAPIRLGDDPVPFILVRTDRPGFVIRNEPAFWMKLLR